MPADESYPSDLRYHPEHDWVRAEGDEAVFGITWYAQDALGEVVYYEPPAVGATVVQGRLLRRARVGEGRVGHLRPRQRRGGGRERRRCRTRPEVVNDDPYGEGWLIRVRLSDPAELDALMDEPAYRDYLAGLS